MMTAAEGTGEAEASAFNSSLFFLIVLISVLIGYWIRSSNYKYATEASAPAVM